MPVINTICLLSKIERNMHGDIFSVTQYHIEFNQIPISAKYQLP
jgi:hypothetical protein